MLYWQIQQVQVGCHISLVFRMSDVCMIGCDTRYEGCVRMYREGVYERIERVYYLMTIRRRNATLAGIPNVLPPVLTSS